MMRWLRAEHLTDVLLFCVLKGGVRLFPQDNQAVGVGSGSTIVYAVDRLGKLPQGQVWSPCFSLFISIVLTTCSSPKS